MKKQVKREKPEGGFLPDHLERSRTHVEIGPEYPSNTAGIYSANSFISQGVDQSFSVAKFRETFQCVIRQASDELLQMDLIGVDAPVANALRRILLAEVPTMAIERVFLVNNSSPLPDEVLVHRLGLVPIAADPRLFSLADQQDRWRGERDDLGVCVPAVESAAAFAQTGPDRSATGDDVSDAGKAHLGAAAASRGGDQAQQQQQQQQQHVGQSLLPRCLPPDRTKPAEHVNSSTELEFQLDITVPSVEEQQRRKKAAAGGHEDPFSRPTTSAASTRPGTVLVTTKDLRWIPAGDQATRFGDAAGCVAPTPAATAPDICLVKMRPGQQIRLRAICVKGIGKVHAKWSPVATASYRMLPQIDVLRPVTGDRAQQLVNLCPAKVFDIEDGAAVVSRPQACTMCRECIRDESFRSHVRLSRVKNHFLFNVESTGALPAVDIVEEGLDILKGKCQRILALLEGK